jgi:DNA-binding MarR family transcriptional regulator
MLERSEGASVAEIGLRLGWLPHTVRAAITGLRKAGREVTRRKDADDRSVYRLAPREPAGERYGLCRVGKPIAARGRSRASPS